MEFTITREQLDDMQKYGKLYSYIQQSFTKTYFSIGKGVFSIFFYGQKGALKTTFNIDTIEGDTRYFQIDYSKWINALSKLSFAKEVTLKLSEKFLKVFVSGSSDIINLGIFSYEKDSSEMDTVESFIPNYIKRVSASTKNVNLTEDLISAITAASSMFSTAGNNNAIALFPHYVMYADRSIVLKANLKEQINIPSKVVLHKYTAGILPFLYSSYPLVQFAQDFEVLLWDDTNGTQLVLASEPCEITIPTEAEVTSIAPQGEKGILVVPPAELQLCLNFFNGFYEASVWKPITFMVVANKEASLHYKHSTAEISKDLGVVGDMDGEFVIGSESLLKLINKAVNTVEGGEVTFEYDADAPGVSCNIAGLFDVVFAKLVE